ncbi:MULTISPECIES: PD-(D/E)XK nuclease family protein [Myroides]|uniref:Uncharacterized protein n=2 Tax=Myroides odoratimimus TaxID=76832 RepID=A0A0S7E6Z0_9FLAO|nr:MULTISPECIES: PD-(D/E)XK nuclease family protein [Myroides]AJA68641.1 PD-(D/E)XK nuclease superfamily [Myroides sp. A21]ALU25910.1 hypothetical protein AS202_07030 [Myroides odoratimimus]EHO11204.1 hypothetical protein HMPREF9712_00861 [Myroides odoratimimus CCUG 10230]EHO14400.1 hypothetical protein HMPREF9714_00418 [Myroides odoratimimus CCUG 12901]EPH10676.1 hypothetical protein HMPREF9713_02488 [Myroides odoratimimus CCUG 12700]
MVQIKNLLSQISIIDRKNTETLATTGGLFNMFAICGVNHYENTHSAIIAELLNPKGSHGLKHKLLDAFIQSLDPYFSIPNFNSETAKVHREYSTPQGRIDIFIEDDNNNAIIIENKIYAEDQDRQLIRYDTYAKDTKQNYQILYLSLYGEDASEQSSAGVTYLPIAHGKEIIDWLEQCVTIASRFPIVRETIIQYINHLKQLTGQDMDSKNKEEIVAVLSKIENLKAAQAIAQNYVATFDYLAEKYVNPLMEEFAKENGLEYVYEESKEEYMRFYFTNTEWKGKFWIGFTFESKKYHYGIVNNPKTHLMSIENRAIIHKKLEESNVTNRKTSEWWPFYAYNENLTLENWQTNIIESTTFVEDCKIKILTLLRAIGDIEI